VGLLKKIASQTAIYGLSSMLGRFINFLLVIPHTSYLKSVGSYGDITSVFAIMAFMNVVLTYGMETTYFYFIRSGKDAKTVFANGQKSLLASTLLFAAMAYLLAPAIAPRIGFSGHVDYLYACLIFLVFDTLSALPFARLRHEEKPLKYAFVKLFNIGINVSLNLYFLIQTPEVLSHLSQVNLILLANAIASFASFLVLSPLAFDIAAPFEWTLLKSMLKYAWPLIFVGLAGIVNETLDRTLLKVMLSDEEGSYQNGIYGAFYKLTMVMTMFVQAYRFAAEPLFFKQADNHQSKENYANIMYWFIAVCLLIFLMCMFYIEPLAHLFIRNPDFFKDSRGLYVVPILLLANLFLGIYYNLSIWYRFTNKTKTGAVVAISGAFITIVGNWICIPLFGFVACAWITLLVYAGMCIAAYYLGQQHYHVPYQVKSYLINIGLAIVIWLGIDHYLPNGLSPLIKELLHILGILLLLGAIWIHRPKVKIH
jgi:O-antigen/teichoic acid export membrane protein